MSAAKKAPKDLAASVRQRLLNVARSNGEDFNAILLRFATERLLFRLSRSSHSRRLVLKGAWLFHAWNLQRRGTRDVDFLGFGEGTVEAVEAMFREIAATVVEPDGVTFHPETLRVDEIRDGARYPGIRVRMEARVGAARVSTQIDVGFGDAMITGPEVIELSPLLPFPAPRLLAYSAETAAAEKLEAIVRFGIVTTRFKDFFDLQVIANERRLDGRILRDQIRETFARRGTELPEDLPDGLADRFAQDPDSLRQWAAFVARSGSEGADGDDFGACVARVRQLVLPPLGAAATDVSFTGRWVPEEGWVGG